MSEVSIHQKPLHAEPSLTPYDLTEMAYEQFEQLGSLFCAISKIVDDASIKKLANTGHYLCADFGGIYDCENERIRHHNPIPDNSPAINYLKPVISENNGHDKAILALGEELESIYTQMLQVERLQSTTTDKEIESRARTLYDNLDSRMADICMALASFKATTLEAAAIQMRAISNNVSMNYDDVDRQIMDLISSVVSVLETKGNFSRNRWAGEYYLPPIDSFEKVEK